MKKSRPSVDSSVEKFYGILEKLAEKAVSRIAGIPKLGTVKSVSGSTARVLIDGDSNPIPATMFCPGIAVGKRVIVTTRGTQSYVTGVKQ